MGDIAYKEPPWIEIIDGKTVMMSPRPRVDHNRIIRNLTRMFGTYLLGKPCEVFADGADVHLDEKNLFIPDVMIVCNPDIIRPDAIYGAPDLVVEILSPSTARNDRISKLQTYGKAGVREYWIVSPLAHTVEVCLQQNGTLALDNVYIDAPDWELENMSAEERAKVHEDIKVSLYDDFIVSVHDIFYKVER